MSPPAGSFFQADAREPRGGLVILVLRPALEGMVVALVAVEPHGEEEVRGVLHRVLGLAENLVVARGRVVLVRAVGRDDFARELVVRRVVGDLLADPVAERLRALRADELAVHLEQVGPLVRPMLHVVLAAHELVHERVALLAGRALVREERLHLVRAGRHAGEVEEDAADELVIGAEVAGQNLHALPLRGAELINLVPLLRLGPGEAAAVAHHRHGRRGVSALEAREHRSLAPAQGRHHIRAVSLGHVLVAGLDERERRHVARGAVGVGGEDAHLLARADLLHDGVLRGQLNLGHAR